MLFEMYKNFFYDANTRRHFFIAAQEYRASNSKGQLISKCLFSVFNSPKKPVVYQKPKLSAEKESFQLSAFGFGRRN